METSIKEETKDLNGKIDKLAIETANNFKHQTYFDERVNDIAGNIAYQAFHIGALEQSQQDWISQAKCNENLIKKACKCLCETCPKKGYCSDEGYFPCKQYRDFKKIMETV